MIFDYRQTPRAKEGYFICLGKQHTYLLEWENFDTAPQNPQGDAPKFKSWAEFLQAVDFTFDCRAFAFPSEPFERADAFGGGGRRFLGRGNSRHQLGVHCT